MNFRHAGKPTKIKKIVYLFASVILGFLLSVIAHGVVEIIYLKWAMSRGILVDFYNGCALLPIFQTVILIIGIAGGFFLGIFWWNRIYIRRSWEKKH